MKLGTVTTDRGTRVVLIEDDRPVRLLPDRFRDVGDVVRATAKGAKDPLEGSETCDGEYTLVAPLPRPARNVFCVGKNYHEHAQEFSRSGFDAAKSDAIPQAPIIFSKVPESVVAPRSPIRFDPAVSSCIDYEGELAVIVGKSGKRIGRDAALDHVWGYTIINDVTARDVQQRLAQWHVGKSFDTFCPMGPWAVTKDEIDLADTRLRTWVNGELRQDANTRDLIFDVPTIIEVLSAGMTLYPGDVIATGTPAGVGIGFSPPKYLCDGDSVEVEIEGIGKLENGVVTGA